MKRFLLAILLCFAVNTQANDLTAIMIDSIAGADTAAETVRLDTTFSESMDVRGYRFLQFYSVLSALEPFSDTNFVDDTFFVNVQTSADKLVWLTHEVDTFLANGSQWSILNLDADATVYGNWARAMIIHWDTLGADSPGLEDNVYKKKLKLWVIPKGGSN